MNNLVRQKLREIIEQYGEEIAADPRRCKGLLLDYCGQYRREIFVLTTAQEENIPRSLQNIPDSVPLSVLMAQLTRRLVENRALDETAARWAAVTWAYALGMKIDEPSHVVTPGPAVEPPLPTALPSLDTPPPLPPSPKAAPATTYTSKYVVEIYARPRDQANAKWQRLGATPGKVTVPPDMTLGLRPSGVAGNALADWVKEIPIPLEVTSLELSDPVSDTGIFSLSKLANLTLLALNRADALSDTGMSYLAKLPRLVTLTVAWCERITDNGLDYLHALLNLNYLTLAWANVTDAGLAHLRNLTPLVMLGLRECKHITGATFTNLNALTKLVTLELAGCSRLSNQGLRYLSNLTSLRKLDLSRCSGIDRQGIVHLSRLPQLSYLDLSRNPQVRDTELISLCNLPALSSLSLAHTRIGNKGLTHVGDMFNLIYLDLSWCEALTDAGLLPLRRLEKLAYLDLRGCKKVTARGVAKLSRPGLYISQ
ncbi:MAG TPA: hypothetical protein PKH77_25635 [Anaerolineae bacterium]|nr:hypothetical protein [Anaerolineae bacterium]